MANKEVEFEDEAADEVETSFKWYLTRGISAAEDFVQELCEAVDSIAAAPGRWPRSADGTRRVLLKRFPFIVYYRELPSTVKIIAVAHAYRRPGYWKERL
jgi:plasmid stabilization system protein ParE